jgi:hypothetical protein
MDAACVMIMRGDDAQAIMQMLRATCTSVQALSVCISRIRTLVIPKLLMTTCDALAPYLSEVGVASFMSSTLMEKVRIQRAHRTDVSWSNEAEYTLRNIQLLPPNASGLKLSEFELISLSRVRAKALILKQQVINVYAAGNWLQHVISMVLSSTTECSFPYIAIPLLILSGRRSTEIMNGKSSFAPSSLSTTTSLFTGQIKRRGKDMAYEIPLLCDYDVFAYGISILRAKQRGETLESAACNNRYHKMLNTEMARICPQGKTVHSLRAMYAAYVYFLYTSNVTFNRAVMQVLGHDKLDVSLSYNSWVLHDMEATYPKGCMGVIPYEVS